MGKIQVLIPDELETEFRLLIAKRSEKGGYRHGALKESIIEALSFWINSQKQLLDLHPDSSQKQEEPIPTIYIRYPKRL